MFFFNSPWGVGLLEIADDMLSEEMTEHSLRRKSLSFGCGKRCVFQLVVS